jgi:SNF2 family DNA or RNA helicase
MAAWGVGACLADDMGLGKTVQALALLLSRGAQGPALVLAPTSVCFNWVRETQRFAPGLKPILFRPGDRMSTLAALGPNDVLISTYGLMLQEAAQLSEVRFATLVLDEAQAIKNPATRRARAARDLNADWRLALTGTPMENHLGELWSLFRVLTPGLLGSWEQFRDRFAAPIERNRDPVRLKALARVIRPFVLRRKKAEVAPELPARTEMKSLVTLSPAERRMYDDARLAAIAQLEGAVDDADADKRFEVLAAITRLRQLACHPQLYDRTSQVPSSKLARFLELVDELRENGHRALVFSQFTSHLALAREALDARKIGYLYLDGQTPEAERANRVDAFQRGEAELFLISLKAGGTGLNLTAANYVLHLDPWWNPAVEDQATDRAHRIGQTQPVTVYRLVSKGTIEEAILALHDQKRDLVAGVLDGATAAARLSTEELLALIRAGESAPELEVEDAEDEVAPASQAEASAAGGARVSLGVLGGQVEGLLFEKGHYAAGTVASYRRAIDRFLEHVQRRLGDQAAPSTWAEVLACADGYLAVLDADPVTAGSSAPKVARAALGALRRLAEG